MYRVMRFQALIIVIVATTSSCDNVGWGGIEVRLERPLSSTDTLTTEPMPEEEEATVPLPSERVLFLVRSEDGQASIMPLFEIAGDSLRPLPLESQYPGFLDRFIEGRLSPGTEFVVFSAGGRVGSFHLTEGAEVADEYCYSRPRVPGILETVPGAAEVQDFLALPRDEASAYRHRPVQRLETTRAQRVLSLNLAGEVITEAGARWPATTVLDIRRDIQAVLLDGRDDAFAATFVNLDGLTVGAAPSQAYSLFLFGVAAEGGYEPAFSWFRNYARDGKAAPRFLANLDWDEDSSDELLLEVSGVDTRWFMVAERSGPRWEVSYEDTCGAQRPDESDPA